MKLISLFVILAFVFTSGAYAQTSVTTWQADSQHTGQNLKETILTPGTVSSKGSFGLLFTQPTDGQIYGQPLVAAGVTIGGASHNVVYVATQHDSLYAFDADSNTGGNASPLWQDSFIQSGVTEPVPQADVNSSDISDELGITTTPVIDLAGGTIYIVSKIKKISDSTYHQYLHALDLATGAEKFNGPVEINPTFAGSANYSGTEQTTAGVIPFNALREHLRCAMALNNGVIYLAYASHSDSNPYHGEILGYNSSTLQLTKSFISTPNGSEAGFWGAGASPAFDTSGNLYIATGNGAYDQTSSPYTTSTDWGESMLKIPTSGALAVSHANTLNWFTPSIWQNLNNGDLDLGSSGLLLLPDQAAGPHTHILIGGGKGGVMYVVDRDNMSGLNSTDSIVQEFTTPSNNYAFVTPAYYNGCIYYSASGSQLEQRTVGYNSTTGTYISTTSVKSSQVFNGKGSGCFISANGGTGGVVWILTGSAMQAYDATNVSLAPLISITSTTEKNVVCQNTKFSLPSVANGKAYFTGYVENGSGTNRSTGYLFVCGLFASASGTPAAPSNAVAAPASSTTMTVTWTDNSNNETSFVVKRATSSTGPFTATGSLVAANVTTFTDTGLSPNTTYYYQVVAQNSAGSSSVSNVASAATFPVYSANGLVAYWSLDDSASSATAADSSGNGHTGTVNGEAVFADALINNGIDLHGTGNATSNISVPNTASMQFTATQSFTLSAWVQPGNIHGVEQAVIAKSADQGSEYGIWINASNQYVFRGPSGDVAGSTATTGEWEHIAVVQDGTAGTRKIYVSGVLEGTGTAQAANGAGALWMGQQNNSAALDSFPGEIDEVRLYNRALAASEITTLMGPPILEVVSSQKQGTSGTYNLIIAPTTQQICEPREGSTTGSYTLILSFSAPVSGITATLGLQGGGTAKGSVSSLTYDSTEQVVTVKLTGVTNGQALNLHLSNIEPEGGTADIPFNVLWGDVNSDNITDYLDAAIVTNSESPLVTGTNYLDDLNCDGVINSSDSALATSAIGSKIGTELDTNMALYQPAADLTSNNPNFAPLAFDNLTGTRWESVQGVDPQWLEVDLGSVSAIHSIVLNWETAAGANYYLQSSTDNINWTNLLPEITGNTSGGIKTYAGLTGSGRFVRMYGLTRVTVYGYSLYEFQVIGIPGSVTGNLAPSITGDLSKSGTQGQSLSYQVTAANSPTSFSTGSLPGGLSINTSTGLISGTPTVSGNVTGYVTASNSHGNSITTPILFTLTGSGNTPVITSSTTATGTVGTAFSYQIVATNSPTAYTATGLPAGLSVNATTGLISGTPTTAATSTVTLTAKNASGTGTGSVAITFAAKTSPPVITSASTASGTTGAAFSYQISATNTPTSYNATGLPAGLSISTTTGLISGTPTTAATSTVTLSATNAGGTDTATLTSVISSSSTGDAVLSQGATAVASSVTGTNTANLAFDGSASTRWESQWADPQWIYVDLGAVDTIHSITLNWEVACGQNYLLQVSNDATNWTTIVTVTNNATSGVLNYTGLNATGRYVRMYGTTRATQYGYSLWEFQVYGTAGTPDTNVALNKTATATSDNQGNLVSYAFDGNTSTRWESQWADPQSIQVDLGAVYNIDTIVLNWETAAGADYTLQVSNDNVNWTIVQTVTGNTSTGVLTYSGLATSGRYVKMAGTKRATQYGYSLWEFQVLGNISSSANLALNKTATATSDNQGNLVSYAFDGNTSTRWESQWSDPQSIQVDLGAVYSIDTIVLNWETAAGADYTLQVSNDNVNWTIVKTVTGNTSTGVLTYSGLATSGRYVKMAGTKRATQYGYSLWEFQVLGSGSSSPNLALNQPVRASSAQDGNAGTNANDGSTATRWAASDDTMPQTWTVDLGATKTLSHVDIAWYLASTRAYQYHIDVSTNNSTFTTVVDQTGNTTFGNTSDAVSTTARYVRVTVTGSGTSLGWASFYEVGVFGN